MKTKTIILGVTGSIAAYKSADLASKLSQLKLEVHVVLTQDGARFITPLTLKTLTHRPVITSLYDEELGNRPTHVELADSADLVLIAPATANILAKMAHGIADDALTAMLLVARAPVLVAPAMNGKMWDHPATVANVKVLRSRGVHFIGPQKGMLACGYEGLGRLWETDGIVKEALKLLK